MEREHISTAFDVELNDLRQSILIMGGKVELMIANSVKSLVDRDTPLAERTIALPEYLDELEIEQENAEARFGFVFIKNRRHSVRDGYAVMTIEKAVALLRLLDEKGLL